MNEQKRVQRKREKGWRMPEGCKYVGRNTKWGNPFKIMHGVIYGNASHRRGKILSPWIWVEDVAEDKVVSRAVELYRQWIEGYTDFDIIPCPFTKEDVKKELANLDLACFCPISSPCHADVLLEIVKS